MDGDGGVPPVTAGASAHAPPRTGLRAKLIGLLTLFAGLAVGTALVGYYGFGDVGAALATAGWAGFLSVVALHGLVLALCGIAWWVLLPRRETGPWIFIWGRLIRDAGAEVLPLSQVGGYVVGARAVTVQGVTAALAIATTVVDVTMEVLGQLVYTGLGLALLLWLRPKNELAAPVGGGLMVAVVVVALFIFAQHRGVALVEKLTARIAQRWIGQASEGSALVQDKIRQLYRHWPGVRRGFALHVLCWIASASEVWVALQFLNTPLDPGAVIVIESLLYAIRSVAFAVPNALGVQEGAYIMLGAIFGLSPQTALALSLLKRGRDLALGIPSLLVWQSLEGKRFLRPPAL